MHAPSPRQIASAALIALLSLGAFTACEPPPPPPPPPPILVVTTGLDGPDAVPGDGVCEMSTGAGDCSLQAALQEGDTLGRAHIQLAAGAYQTPPLTITGDISITGVGDYYSTADVASVSGGPLDVASGGRLTVDDTALNAQLSVEGAFIGRSLYMFWPGPVGPQPGPRVQVSAGGVAYFENTILPHTLEYGDGALHNDGLVILNYSTLSVHYAFLGDPAEPALHNEGIVVSSASYLDGCSGTPPVSQGYNAAPDDSCALDAPTDMPNVHLTYRDHPSYLKQYFIPLFRPDSPLLDAIPEGVNGCGTTITDDLHLQGRPYDGDGDGTPACDIGAREAGPFG